MTRQYEVVELGELLELNGEEICNNLLSSFICEKNDDVKSFLTDNSIEFSKQKIAITYLVFCIEDNQAIFVGYYTLANKCVSVPVENISKSLQKKISKFAQFDEASQSYQLPMPLVAQLGRHDLREDLIEGKELLRLALSKVKEAQDIIGGKTTYIECASEPKLRDFYEENNFVWFGASETENDESLDQMMFYYRNKNNN